MPNAVGDVALFTNNISAARTITVDGTRTVGTLQIGDLDSTHAFTISGVPTGGSLVFDVATGQALLNFSSGAAIANTLTVPIVLNDDLRIAITGSSTAIQVINGPISGAKAMTIDANGTHGSAAVNTIGQLQFNGINTFSGGLTVGEVRLQVANAFALGTGTVTVNDGGQLFLTAGTATFNNNFVLNTLGWNETGQGQFGALRSDQATVLNGNITLASSSRVGGTGTNTVLVNGVISETGGARDFDINRLASPGAASTSQWAFNNTNTYTGKTTVYAGTLRIGNGGTTGSLGATSEVDLANGTLEFRRSDDVIVTTPFVQLTGPINGVAVTGGNFIHSGTGTLTLNNSTSAYTGTTVVNGVNGRLLIGTGGAYTFSGGGSAITLSNGADLELNTSSNITLSGAVGGAANSYLIQSGTGTTTLTGTGDNNGLRAQVNAGTLVLNKTSGTVRSIGGGGDIGLTINGGTARLQGAAGDQIVNSTFVRMTGGTLDLNGTAESIDGLNGPAGTVTNGSIVGATLTIGANNASAAFVNGVAFPATFGGIIQDGAGAIAVIKSGTALNTFSGANTYSGLTTVNAGVLAVNGSLRSTGSVALNGGALSGTGSVGNIVLTATPGSAIRPGVTNLDNAAGTLTATTLTVDGGDLRFNLGTTNDRINVTGAVTLNAASILTATFAAAPVTTTLMSGASIVGTLPTLSVPVTTRSTLALNNTGTALILDVSGPAAQALTWSGTANGNWDLATNFNWNTGTESFFNLDSVSFGDGPTNRTVTLAAGLTPTSVVVNNSTGNDYTFQTGSLAGTGNLSKSGTGLLIVNLANSAFSGDVTITGGTLRTSNAAALGDTAGVTRVSNGGTLDLNAQNLGAEQIFLAGAGVGGNGALINGSGTQQQNAARFVTLTSDATIGGAGRFDIRANGGGETLDLAGFTLTKTGANQFSLVGARVSDGSIVVNQGIFSLETTSLLQGVGTITYNSGTTAQFFQSVAANITRPMVWNGNFVDPAGQTNGVASNITLAGDATLQGTGTLNFSGNVTENGGVRSITKGNTSTYNFTGNVSYTGATTVNGGTLTFGGGLATTVPATSAVNLTGGGLLNYFISGNTTLAVPVNIAASGGTLRWSGATQGSTLTLSTTVGGLGFGALSVQQGTVTLASGANVSVNTLEVGRTSQNTNNIGTLNIQPGATVTIGSTFFIGESATGLTGIVNQTGGSVTLNAVDAGTDGNFRIGHWSGQGSTYNMSGGTISVLNATTSIGIDGIQPAFNISGGTVTLKRLFVDGRNNTTPIGGYLNLSGGILAIGDGGIGTFGQASINLSGGTLQAYAPSTWSVGMNFENNTPTIDLGSNNVTMSGAINGAGGFTKTGSGAMTLSNAASSFAGTVTVNAGSLGLNGNLTGNGTVIVNTGGTLFGAGDGFTTGRANNVVLNAGSTLTPGVNTLDATIGTLATATLNFNGATARYTLDPVNTTAGQSVNDLVTVTGALTLNGGNFLPVWSSAPSPGTYTLITAGSVINTLTPTVNPAAATSRQTYTLGVTGTDVTLTVAGAVGNLTWSGDGVGNVWDLNAAQNWKIVAANDAKFLANDNVTFDNTGSATPNINLVGTLVAGSVTINATANYTFAGTGSIAGGSLTKNGTGTLVLANNNSYPGLTTINTGVVRVGNGGTAGSLGTGAVNNEATLIFDRSDDIAVPNVINGAGSIVKRGNNTLTLSGVNGYFGPTTISKGTVLVLTNSGAGSGPVTLGDADTGADNVAFLASNNVDPANEIIVSGAATGTATIGTAVGGTTNSIFSGALTLNRPTTLQGADLDRTSFSGLISGLVGTLTISGGRRVTIENTGNNFVGDIIVTGGGTIFQASVAGPAEVIPDASNVTLSTGTTFQLASSAGGVETINALNGAGTVTNVVAGLHTLALGSAGGSGSYTGTVNNGGTNANAIVALTKLGTGTQLIGGAVTSTGSITINGGVFEFGNAFGGGATKAAQTTDATLDNILTVTGATTNVTSDLVVGMSVTGTGVPVGSRILSIPNTTTVTIAGTQTATLAGNLTFGAAPLFLNGNTFRYSGAARTDDRLFDLNTSGGIIEASGTGALTLSATALQLAGTGARTLTLGGTSTAANTLAAVIADAGGATSLVKTGTGTWVVSGAGASYTGGASINAGVLRLGTNNKPLGDNFAVNVANGATLDVNGQNGATATRRYDVTISGSGVAGQAAIWNSGAGVTNNPIFRSITLVGDTSIGGVNRYDLNGGTIDGAGVTFNGGTFTLTKVGGGELWWSPVGGATVGSIVIDGGTFGVQSSFNLGTDTLPIVINAGGTLNTFGGQTNFKDITINGGILATNNGLNSWNGKLLLSGLGTTNRIQPGNGLQLNLGGQITGLNGFEKLGTGIVDLQGLGSDWSGDTRVTAGTLRTSSFGSLSPNTTLDLNGGTVDLFGTTQTVAGLKGATGTIDGFFGTELTVNQSADTAFGGVIANGVALTKSGSGVLALNGINTTTSDTNINGGRLDVSGSLSGNTIKVNAGGTLGGAGTVGIVDVLGGAVAPGTGAGTLSTGAFSLNASSTLKFELAQPGVIGLGINDLLSVTGNLTLDGTLQVTELAGFTNGTYRLFNYTGALTNNGLAIDPAFLLAHQGSSINVLTAGQVNLVVVPEPGSLASLTAGLGLLAGIRRNRRRSR